MTNPSFTEGYHDGDPPVALYDQTLVVCIQDNATLGIRYELARFSSRLMTFERLAHDADRGPIIVNSGTVLKWMLLPLVSKEDLPAPPPDPTIW